MNDARPRTDSRFGGGEPSHRGAQSKDMVMLPWDCSVSKYQLRHGMVVPTRGGAAKGGNPYFVGDLTSLVYEFAP